MHPDGKSFFYEQFASNVYKSSIFLKPHQSFIIDTGATNHMCFNINLLWSMTKFSQPHKIGLPNGYNLLVSHYGDVQIHDYIMLQDVLYVPSFRYNHISISKPHIPTLNFCLIH